MGEVVERVTRKNEKLSVFLPLTISAQNGLVAQTEFFDKQVAGKNLANYYLIEKGEFAYNKSYSNGYPLGAIKRLDKYESGLLSILYILFKPTKVSSQFLVAYYDSNHWHKAVSDIAVEGARNHGLLNIPTNDFFETQIFIPPTKAEQQAIGEFFKQLDDTIAFHQRTQKKYQNLKKSYLEKMFAKINYAWKQRKLGEVVEFFSGLTYSPKNITDNGGVLVLRSSNIQNDFLYLDDNVYVKQECANSENVQLGDIIVVVRNGSRNLIGKHAIIMKNMKKTVIGAFMTGIRYKHYWFLNALLNTETFKYEIEKNLGATINQITMGMFKEMKFYFPSEAEQQAIGEFFKQLDDTIAFHQRELEKYQQLKQVLLDQLFV